jgi:photosystem II stability/assembly factor-like uncharacterized protein
MIGRLGRMTGVGVIVALALVVSAFASGEPGKDQTAGTPRIAREPGSRLPVGRPKAVAQSRSAARRLYAATEVGLFASDDEGRHWDRLQVAPLRNDDVLALAVHPLNEERLFVGGRAGLWKSLDGGGTWKPISAPAGVRSAIRSIAVAHTALEIIYIGTERDGVFRSPDGGSSWSPASHGLPEALSGEHVASIRSLVLNPATPSIAFAGTDLHGLYKTTDGGASWTAINQGLGPFPLQWRVGSPSIVIDRADPQQMMAMVLRPFHSRSVKTFVYQSSDGGEHWFALEVEVPPDAQGVALAEDPSDLGRVVLLTTTGAIQIQWHPVAGVESKEQHPVNGKSRWEVIPVEWYKPFRARCKSTVFLFLVAFLATPAWADFDSGNIAVIETDPTILQPGEQFDLAGKTLTFTPKAGGGYTISVAAGTINSNLGTNLNLNDDASTGARPLGFSFPFFGTNYTTLFVNSNGYATFGTVSSFVDFNVPDATDLSTVLDRMAEGLPRIAPLWNDLDPTAGGGVFFNALPGRTLITWNAVPQFGAPGTSHTFQLTLFPSGIIRLTYGTVSPPSTDPIVGGFLVGISPGSSASVLTTTLDLHTGSGGSLTIFPDFEPLVQVFGGMPNPLVHIPAVASRFYHTHGDSFDQLVMFANFSNALGNALAFAQPIRVSMAGTGQPLFNGSSFFGSSGRLHSMLNMNRLSVYPDDLNCLANPQCRLPGNNDSTLTLMGQEAGHQWLAHLHFNDAGVSSNLLLGRDLSHWSFFLDSDASDMEGNNWVDHGNGTFASNELTIRFSPLDQYAMGLRSAGEVTDFFFIRSPIPSNPCLTTDPRGGSVCQPQVGVNVSGTRQNVTISQITAVEGIRPPGLTGVNPTTVWHQAFILLIRAGTTPSSVDFTKIDTIRSAWIPYFANAVDGRASISTSLGTLPPAATVALNGSAFHTAQTINYQATLTPGATLTPVDIYLGALLPDGVTFFSLIQVTPGVISTAVGPAPIPFLANVSLVPLVVPFSYTFTGFDVAGTYFTYAGLTVAGSDPLQPTNRLSLAVESFQFTPWSDDSRRPPISISVREYTLQGIANAELIYRLLTSILDFQQAFVQEVAALYRREGPAACHPREVATDQISNGGSNSAEPLHERLRPDVAKARRCEDLVAVTGLEPVTPRIWAACSDRLSYTAVLTREP